MVLPVGHRPEFCYVKTALARGCMTCLNELSDESPFGQVNPVTVEEITHGRALEPGPAQPFQGGVAWLTGTLTQLPQVTHETPRNAQLIQLYEAP
jgi:hypothetical protein